MIKDYPKTIAINNEQFKLRFMDAGDRDRVMAFTRTLNETDLWFMWYDFTRPNAFDEWINDIEADRARTILVCAADDDDDQVLAFGSLHYNQLFWNRHLGEMRVMVGGAVRGRGMGQKLAREITLLAKSMKLSKVIVYMAASDQAARRMADYLDFEPEAILRDWIKGRDDRTHDLLIMSHDLSELLS